MSGVATAPGTNPNAAAAATREEATRRGALFDKLVAVGSRSTRCLQELAELTRDAARYEQVMAELETHVRELDEDPPAARLEQSVADPSLRPLCRRITDSGPLFHLFLAEPLLSGHSAVEVGTLAAIADLRPHPEHMLAASDGPFMRILRQRSQPGMATPAKILQDDFLKLIKLRAAGDEIMGAVSALAVRVEWPEEILAVEQALESGQPGAMAGAVRALFDVVCKPEATPDSMGGVGALFLATPRLSEMLREEVSGFCGIHEGLPDPDQVLSSSIYAGATGPSDEEKQRRLAQLAVEALPPAAREDVLARLELRVWAADHCLELRSFAKLNALERQWPELARLLRTDRATLKALEGEALNPGTIATEHRPLWERYQRDERLRRFLAIRPLATDIRPADVRHYFAVSQSIGPAGVGGLAGGAAGGDTLSPPIERVGFTYTDVILRLLESGAEEAPAERPSRVTVTFQLGRETAESVAEIPWPEIDELMESLYRLVREGPAIPGASTRDLTPRVRSIESSLELAQRLGTLMWRWPLQGPVLQRMNALLRQDAAYRLVFDLPPPLMMLPWETLFAEQPRTFLALTQRFSVVRYLQPSLELRRTPITPPLRILAVLANPAETAPLNLEGEEAVLTDAIGPAVTDKRASLQVLRGTNANLEELQAALRVFRPHLFHFVGHGVFDMQQKQGALVLQEGDGARLVTASDMATLLRDARIAIAVLNSCDTGTTPSNDAIAGVAGSLVHAGVPAVVATLREIADQTALMFTRELYRAFCEGYPLEAAVTEARKALSLERGDWSAYALFASTRQLEALVFPQNATVRKS
ncbi:MAG: CHAT domain-containing protein [Gemmatimonadales bacterium]